MKATLEQVAEEAMSLSLPDRSALTRILLQTLDSGPVEDSAEVEKAWQIEVEERVDAVLAGRAKTTPAKEVFDKMRAKYG